MAAVFFSPDVCTINSKVYYGVLVEWQFIATSADPKRFVNSKGNPYPKMAKTFRVKDLHPRNLTWNLKSEVPRKVSSSWKPSFSGSMLNFGGV